MEEFSSLAPGVVTGGTVRIGSYSAVSLGANIIQGRAIGRHTVIGAGALVLEDIPDFSVVYGVPATVVRKRKEGDKYL
jgi:acetyltransferase-like isoleucine patch superfamily enzyme